MLTAELISQALTSLTTHRLRSVLTMLGIIVGVFTVMLTLSLGAGARQAISEQILALGSNLVVVNSGPPPASGQEAVYLYPVDAAAILRYCPSVAAVDEEQEERFPVTTGSAQLQDNFVMGVTSSYADIRKVELSSGRFFLANEDERAAKVAVLGETVRQYLFGNGEALNHRVRIGGIDFRVVGIMTPRGDSPGLGPGMSTDDRVFIPLSALDKRMLGSTMLRLITISSRSAESIPEAAEEVRALLAKRHPNNPFEIRTQTELMQTSSSVSGIVNLLLTSLAAVSLAVGGIGIMNIMLVAVSERTRKIGVRRAVGAARANIMSQFLMESIVPQQRGRDDRCRSGDRYCRHFGTCTRMAHTRSTGRYGDGTWFRDSSRSSFWHLSCKKSSSIECRRRASIRMSQQRLTHLLHKFPHATSNAIYDNRQVRGTSLQCCQHTCERPLSPVEVYGFYDK